MYGQICVPIGVLSHRIITHFLHKYVIVLTGFTNSFPPVRTSLYKSQSRSELESDCLKHGQDLKNAFIQAYGTE